MDRMIADSAGRLFSAYSDAAFAALPTRAAAGAAPLPDGLWDEVEAAGFPLALLTEAEGGFDLGAETALGLVRIAAFHAVSCPLGETMVANLLLARAGLDPATGIATLPGANDLTATRSGSGWHLRGTLRDVPWGAMADTIVCPVRTEAGPHLAILPRMEATPAHSLAAEPCDALSVDLTLDTLVPAPALAQEAQLLGALIRAQGIAGALAAVLELTVGYANERKQFGRPIGKFQAIQQDLAILAGEAAAAGAAAEMGARALADALAGRTDGDWRLPAAAAKLRCGEAAGKAAAIAHQVVAAIGFSQEFRLHPLTRRLWAWRDDFGSEAHWARWLGEACCARPDGIWPLLTQPEIRADIQGAA